MPFVLKLSKQKRNILFVDEAVFTQRSAIKNVWVMNTLDTTIVKDKFGFFALSMVTAFNLIGECHQQNLSTLN